MSRSENEIKAEALEEAADFIESSARSFALSRAWRKAQSKSEADRNARTGHRAAGQISVARMLRARAKALRSEEAT